MKGLLEKRINFILIILIFIVVILIVIPTFSRGCATSTSNGEIVTTVPLKTEAETTKSTEKQNEIIDSKVKIKKKNAKNKTKVSASVKTDKRKKTKTKKSEKTKKKSQQNTKVYATAPKPKVKADYNAQWKAGYLVAIDNPDKSYKCGHIELSDKDRETVENLCMGEFASGGFTGTAMIAQAIKNAMYYGGYTDVQSVINEYHYTNNIKKATKKVKEAVIYIFDMDKDAVQHRILYMYNPEQMENKYSEFHEKLNYVCNYGSVRFFDK